MEKEGEEGEGEGEAAQMEQSRGEREERGEECRQCGQVAEVRPRTEIPHDPEGSTIGFQDFHAGTAVSNSVGTFKVKASCRVI